MDEFLRDMDQRMVAMNSADFVREFTAGTTGRPLTDVQRAALEPKEKLFRGMLRTLYLTQTFRDLPEEAQLHPGMQSRMREHIDEVDQTVTDVTGFMSGLDDDQRAKLQQQLRARPDLGMSIGEAIDDQAAIAGVSRKRRLQLRSMMMQASFRLKHSAPGAVIDEYVDKVQRMTAQGGAQADLTLRIAGRASSEQFFQDAPIGTQGGDVATDPAQPAMAPPAQPAPAATPTTPPAKRTKKVRQGSGTVKTGAILMGVAVATAGVSALFVAAGGAAVILGAVGLTVGAILFAVGLIMLIVGALIYAVSDPVDPESL
jgi:hypothetical protein